MMSWTDRRYRLTLESVTASTSVAGRRLAVLTVLLGGFTAFGPLSMDLYLPAFPQLADDLGASQAAVQLTLTADVIGLVVGQLVLGPLSDARGRRGLLVWSTLVCAVASALCALAPSVGWLTVWRFVQGASGGGGIVLARAVAADLTSGVAAARLFSLFMTLSSVAPILAPVLGGVLLATTGSWRPMFWVLAVVSLVLAVATAVVIPETLPPHARHRGGLRATGRAFLGLARDRAFAGYALTVAFAYASFALQDLYGLSATQFSLVFALNAAGSIVLGLLNARLVKRYPVHRILVVGLLGSTVAAVLLLVTVAAGAGLVAVLVPLFVVVASRGLVSANATVLGIERSSAAGSASAVLGALMFAGGVLVTPLLAAGGEGTALPMAAVVAGGAVAALLATVLLARPAAKG
jgi:MFS transporter, DHA1 family, multidrug resistance protein